MEGIYFSKLELFVYLIKTLIYVRKKIMTWFATTSKLMTGFLGI